MCTARSEPFFASSDIVDMSVNVANQCNSRNNYRDVYYKRTGSLLSERKFQEEFFIARDCSLKRLRTWPTSS